MICNCCSKDFTFVPVYFCYRCSVATCRDCARKALKYETKLKCPEKLPFQSNNIEKLFKFIGKKWLLDTLFNNVYEREIKRCEKDKNVISLKKLYKEYEVLKEETKSRRDEYKEFNIKKKKAFVFKNISLCELRLGTLTKSEHKEAINEHIEAVKDFKTRKLVYHRKTLDISMKRTAIGNLTKTIKKRVDKSTLYDNKEITRMRKDILNLGVSTKNKIIAIHYVSVYEKILFFLNISNLDLRHEYDIAYAKSSPKNRKTAFKKVWLKQERLKVFINILKLLEPHLRNFITLFIRDHRWQLYRSSSWYSYFNKLIRKNYLLYGKTKKIPSFKLDSIVGEGHLTMCDYKQLRVL